MYPSYWQKNRKPRRFGKLEKPLEVDVVVVGGGITGITAAYLLKRNGLRVALLERWRCLDGDTGHTTAHLTQVMDWRLTELVQSVGANATQTAWSAGEAAIDQIEEIV